MNEGFERPALEDYLKRPPPAGLTAKFDPVGVVEFFSNSCRQNFVLTQPITDLGLQLHGRK